MLNVIGGSGLWSDFTGVLGAKYLSPILVAIVWLITVLLGIGVYLLHAFALYKVGIKLGRRKDAWMAFIPFANLYFEGSLAGEVTLFKKKIRNFGPIVLVTPIVAGIATGIVGLIWGLLTTSMRITNAVLIIYLLGYFIQFAVLTVAQGANYLVSGIAIRKIIGRFVPVEDFCTAHTLLSVFVPLYKPIYWLMMCRKYQPEGVEEIAVGGFGGYAVPAPAMPASAVPATPVAPAPVAPTSPPAAPTPAPVAPEPEPSTPEAAMPAADVPPPAAPEGSPDEAPPENK